MRWVVAYKDQHGRRHNKGFLTRKDAKAFLVLTLGEVARGVHTPEASSSGSSARACDSTGTTSSTTFCRWSAP